MTKAEAIRSTANPLLKDVRKAAARGGLTSDGCVIAETFHLLEEALRSQCEVRAVLVAESVHLERDPGVRVVMVPDSLLESIAATESSQGIIALVKPPLWTWSQLLGDLPLIVVLDGVQDPGNAGAIVRAAEAFGATGVIFLKGTASPYNPKTLRASAGSLFRVPYLHGLDAAAARAAMQENGIRLYAGVPSGAAPVTERGLAGACALIIGNEAHGVSAELRDAAHGISIPTVGVESLNAAVAAGILLYETRRQREHKT